MGNAEATRLAAGKSVEAIRRGSDKVKQPDADCDNARRPASNKVINTPHEVLFHQALIRARLSFETQSHPDGTRWEADIELHQAQVVIEVTNSPGERRRADQFRRKTEAFQAAGYRVYWFSNHQARTDPDGCVRRVMRENGLQPECRPTMLIRPNRTGHRGSLNPNWGGGPETVNCRYCGAAVTAHKRPGGQLLQFCNSQCYGKWMHEHPETVPGGLRLTGTRSPAFMRRACRASSLRTTSDAAQQASRSTCASGDSCGHQVVTVRQVASMLRAAFPVHLTSDHDMVRPALNDKGAEPGGTETTWPRR